MKVKSSNKGFTLPELVVTLIVLGIILAIGIPTAINYIKHAEFRKNEENAKTIYMAAESVLTWYRSSGQWEDFRDEVIEKGIENTSFTDDEKKGRIYAVTLAPGNGSAAGNDDDPVLALMDNMTYAKDLLTDGAVAIEIDVESGHVYSAFYGTRCHGLGYGTGDKDGILDMNDRAYDSRRERFLGYYSVEDVTNVVDLTPVRLKVTSISLVNSETLYLNWSSNSRHDNMDLEFYVTFCEKSTGKELFRLTVDMAKAIQAGWSRTASDGSSMIDLPMKVNGVEIEGWQFPLIYQDGSFSLVLDGMMSAEVMSALESTSLTDDERTALSKSSDVSITRLAKIQDIRTASGIDLSKPQNIYATVQAISTYQNTGADTSEYRQSSVVSSNTANTLYADDTELKNGKLDAGISAFRHLSNIRYCDAQQTAAFTLNNRELDWNSEGTGIYNYIVSNDIKKLQWTANDGSLQFPSVPVLSKEQSLDGGLDGGKLSNLRLGTDSVVSDTVAAKENLTPTEYAGLFCEAEGSITNITFQNPLLVMGESPEHPAVDFDHLKGIGIVAGQSSGNLTNIQITADDAKQQVLNVFLADRKNNTDDKETAGVGGIAGVLQSEGDTKIHDLSVSGVITAKLPNPGKADFGQAEDAALNARYGIGGLFGYADLTKGTHVSQCENHANVSGNLFTGGIAGHIDGSFDARAYEQNTANAKNMSNLTDCENNGLILCTAEHKDNENNIEGRYFGGIVGFGNKLLVYEASSASGRSAGFTYSKNNRDLLKGQYVGGIMGFGSDCLLIECGTENKGYILGSDYVGGIVGGLTQHSNNFSRIGGGIGVTTNAGYVIGNNYVGGIIGKNDGKNKIENCVNNGVTAGYEAYIGGIAGYNGEGAVISNCASYMSDHDGGIFNQIVEEWAAKGSYAGGVAGYNNGKIEFKDDNGKIKVRSVSGIVVGQNYVGGVVGFNDTQAEIDVAYTLIGGRIYAYGDCVGGYIGLNASTQILDDTIEIRPTVLRGVYCVGGCIGANVVDLKENITMSGYRTNNTLGQLTAKAFAGGVIGYQRTYTAGQLGLKDGEELLDYMQAHKDTVVPQLDTNHVPSTEVLPSDNPYQLVLTDGANSKASLKAAINNLEIRAQMYVGGVLGYCEGGSRLVVKNCKNAGRIARVGGTESETGANGVSVVDYLTFCGCTVSGIDASILTDMAGGISGVNLTNQVIDHCANTGTMTGFTCLGGVVGFNGGGIFNCTLEGNFGNASQDYVGGIAGLNIETSNNPANYNDIYGIEWNSYVPGTIAACTVNAGVTVTGRNTVGGIAACNLPGGIVLDSACSGNVTAYGDYAGGIAGRNGGTVLVSEDNSPKKRTVSGRNGLGIGGLVGLNESTGNVWVSGAGTTKEVTAIGDKVTVIGSMNVGGLIGENEGTLGAPAGTSGTTANNGVLVCGAADVRALKGNAGGIAGISSGNITNAKNISGQVTADTGLAGGIVSSISAGVTVAECTNTGNVNSNYGEAGGIAAENFGTIRNCCVLSGDNHSDMTIRSRHAAQSGTICAINKETGTVTGSMPEAGVTLDSDASIYGAVAGLNMGTIENTNLAVMPEIRSNGMTGLSVGGASGVNQKLITKITATESFINFSNYRYLGGVAGVNAEDAAITDCSYGGSVTESGGSAAGNCYGGIAGINSGEVFSCTTQALTMDIQGVYTATATSSAEEKENLASHTGGIVGKNETTGTISNSYLTASTGSITVKSGMAGGVAGYNKGIISRCGDAGIVGKMTGSSIEELYKAIGNAAHGSYVGWNDNANTNIENLSYNGENKTVSDGKFRLIMSTKGSLGGITAYNSPGGELVYCATGDWFLNNKSEDISVGTGGVIGMNESEKDMSYLVNQAFVGRQLKNAVTNRFAGGIIGNQSNATTEGWTLSHCLNYGTVYGYNSHYCGGIIGQWTGTGGNIEECQNYGSLQTTYATAWVGASAGIVAQLYHAYDGHTYNIISCGNFGSIYGRTGIDINNAANDSAGILGNVTTYQRSQENSQQFTIQVLDCVNGSGVEIYSGSMASGIVGFFSTDNPTSNGSNVGPATCNIQLRIERCRNFASVLSGVQYIAGIFGDRYGQKGAENTVLIDCYSVNVKDRIKDWVNFPIVSMNNNDGTTSFSANVNGAHNYFFDELNNANSYQTGFSLCEGADQAQESKGMISGNAYISGDNKLKRVSGDRAYIMYNQTKRQYFAVYLTDAGKLLKGINGNGCYINPNDGCIYKTDDQNGDIKIAKILFDLPSGAAKYTSTSQLTESGSPFYAYVREGWRVQEGVVTAADGSKKLTAPTDVKAEIRNGKIQVAITPAKNPNPWAEENSLCDPFKYAVDLYIGGEFAATEYLYTENGSVSIPDGFGGAIEVQVRAVSMYHDVNSSDPRKANEMTETILLPTPDIRAELVWDNNNYRYELSLNNLDQYNELAEDNWQVTVQASGQTITLNQANPTAQVEGNANTQSITAQVKPNGLSSKYIESAQVSIPAFMPAYRPDASLDQRTSAALKVEVIGTTLENLSVNVSLTHSGDTLNTPPVYRAELIGRWKADTTEEKSDIIFASQDILVASNGTTSVTFANLPEYIRDASDLKVRIWYAQSGLGPVYTYHELETADGTNDVQMTGLDEDGRPVYKYMYVESLEKRVKGTDNNRDYFEKYRYLSGNLWTWLQAPVLAGVTDGYGGNLSPQYDSDGNLQYTFYWDAGGAFDADAQYALSLMGIDTNGNSVLIDTSGCPPVHGTWQDSDAWSLTVPAEDWNFNEVRLSVTRIGHETSHEIGLRSEAAYQVRQRLQRPEQPDINIDSVDELYYTVTWPAIASETGCSSYQLYAQIYEEETAAYGTPFTLGDPVNVTDDLPYSLPLNLEKYAGKQMRFYLIAQADADSTEYVDSTAGITCDLTVPERIQAPNVTWHPLWEYNRTMPLSTGDFFAGNVQNGLTVKLTADDDSIPPGGSAYLMRAYIYGSEDAAKAAILAASNNNTELEDYLTGYLTVEDVIRPVEMEKAGSDTDYQHTMQGLTAAYAGKWVVFQARISSGSGNISSHWVTSDPQRLPFVKLDQAKIESRRVWTAHGAEVSENPDLPPDQAEWSAEQTAFYWNSGDYADVCYVNITEKMSDGSEIEHQYRIREMDSDGQPMVTVDEWGPDADNTYRWNTVSRLIPAQGSMTGSEYDQLLRQQFVYPLTGYRITDDRKAGGYEKTVEGDYMRQEVLAHYKMSTYACLQADLQADGSFRYTLLLPDTASVRDADGNTLPDSNWRYSSRVTFQMNVIANEAVDEADKSPSYVGSDEIEVKLN